MSRELRRGMVLVLLLLPVMCGAESVTALTAQANGSYILKIDGRQYVALSAADADQASAALVANVALRQKLAEVTARLEQYQSLTDQYEALRGRYLALTGDYRTLSEDALRLNGDYATAANNLVTLTHDYSQLVRDYDGLTEKYRNVALRSHPRQPLDIGIGALHAEEKTHGVVMVGAGTTLFDTHLRGWLFGGRESYGVVLGTSF